SGLDVVTEADRALVFDDLLTRLRNHEPVTVGSEVDPPPVACSRRQVEPVDVPVVDSLEELCADLPRDIGVRQRETGSGCVHLRRAALDGECEERVEQHLVPPAKALLDPGLAIASAPDALD